MPRHGPSGAVQQNESRPTRDERHMTAEKEHWKGAPSDVEERKMQKEKRQNESGVLRVCFGAGQWVSAVSSAGDAILERVSRPQPAPEPSSSWSVDVGGSGVRAGAGGSAAPIPTASEEVIAAFTAVVKSVVRSGAELDSEKVGVVNPGDEVLALAERRVGSTMRVRFSRGWVSVSSSDGATILESVE